VIGVRGGVGASTVSASLAWMMGDKAGRSTALLDLDVHFGTGALNLDLEPGRGLTDAIENPSRIDGLFIERAMVRANDKLCVLSAEAPINQAMLTDGSAFYQLQEEIRHAFEGTVIDLPRHMLVQHPHLVNDVQVVIVVVEFTLAATRDAIRILSWLKANAPQAKVIVVANKVLPAGQEVTRKDFEHSIERKVDIVVPFDAKSATQAAKLGQPLAKAIKSPKLAQPLALLLARTLEQGEPEEAEAAPGGSSLLGRLGNFKSLVARKPSAQAA
jgi:pilus assembly protein CpaE